MNLLPGLTTALHTLTSFPAPGKEAKNRAHSLIWFPLVGAFLGFPAILLYWLMETTQSLWQPEITAFIILLFITLATRGLHLDGLADWADGFWGAYTRDRTLEIMKDSNVGTFGAAAIALVMLGKWIGITACLKAGQPQLLIPALVLSRTVQVDLAGSHSYARSTEGTGCDFIKLAKVRYSMAAIFLAIVITLLSTTPLITTIALVIALVAGRFFGQWCKRRVNGVTGDLLGAGNELIELLLLLTLPAFA